MQPAGDATLALARQHLSAARLYDTMDDLGLEGQIMAGGIRPLNPDAVVCGRARTGNYRDVYQADEGSDFYELLLALLKSLQADDVVVLACGKSERIHAWGSAQASAAAARGAVGCVTDGLVRDATELRALSLQTFSTGSGPVRLRGRGRLVAIDVPVRCGGVWVSPGDLVFGDADGVVVVPRAMEEAVLHGALRRAEVEEEILRKLRAGASLTSLYPHDRLF